MNYEEIFNKLISGELKDYKVNPDEAFEFQKALRNFGKRQNIRGKAQRGGAIIYTRANGDE